jgi:hypothetical protein
LKLHAKKVTGGFACVVEAGYPNEMQTLQEILNLPLEWSSLHGIAEIVNPLFKISTRTDATKNKYTVKLKNSNF